MSEQLTKRSLTDALKIETSICLFSRYPTIQFVGSTGSFCTSTENSPKGESFRGIPRVIFLLELASSTLVPSLHFTLVLSCCGGSVVSVGAESSA